MSATKIAGIGFELSFDGSKMMTGINKACDKVRSQFTASFSEAGKSATKAISTSNQEIISILNDTERSMRSKAASIAWIYRKEGLSQEEAMKTAWSHIERYSSDGAAATQKQFAGISNRAEKSARNVKNSFLKSFLGIRNDAGITGKSVSNSFGSIAFKVGAAIGSVFAAGQVVSFGKECLELGSDLQEVQNVVDVTFPAMSARINGFAKDAITTAGMSETMAKKFTGTFGAMAKSFGFTETQAYDMSTTLTQLAGDVASFYNLSQDEAYTKLKSVFSGETETLKDLGVVMTQSALDAYALANGYGKTTAAMTEMEKVALRYAFVQEKLSAAQGDFVRTSDSWANQTRVMSLQIQSIQANIGQGMINLFTPIIKGINVALGKVGQLAEAFKGLTELITGKKSEGGTGITGDLSTDLSTAADGAGMLADNTGAVGEAAKDAAKEMKALMGFDVIQKLPDSSETSSSSGSGTSLDSGITGIGATDFGALAEGETVVEGLTDDFEELLSFIEPTTSAIRNLYNDGLQKLSGFTWGTIRDFWENFLKPMGVWMIHDDSGLPRFFNITNSLLNDIDWENLKGSLGSFYTSLQGPAKFKWTGMMDLYERFLVPVSDWTMSEAIPELANCLTTFNDSVDWENLNESFGEFWGALSRLTIGIGQGAIDFMYEFDVPENAAGLVNGFADALGWFADVIEGIPEEQMNSLGKGLVLVGLGVSAFKGYKKFDAAVKSIQTGITVFRSAPVISKAAGAISSLAGSIGVLPTAAALLGTGAGLYGLGLSIHNLFETLLHEDEFDSGYEESISGIAQTITDLNTALYNLDENSDSDYENVAGVLDKFIELNDKLVNGDELTDSESSLFQEYYETLTGYAPEMKDALGDIEGGYSGSREELLKLIETEKLHAESQGYLKIIEDAGVALAESQMVYGELQGQMDSYVDKLRGLGGISETTIQTLINFGAGVDVSNAALQDAETELWKCESGLDKLGLSVDDVWDAFSGLGIQMETSKKQQEDLNTTIAAAQGYLEETTLAYQGVTESMDDCSDSAGASGTSFWQTFAAKLSDGKDSVVSSVKELIGKAKEKVNTELEMSDEGSGYSRGVGGAFVNSLISPLTNKKVDVQNAVKSIAGIFPTEFDAGLGISGETSSVMEEKGELTTESLTGGIENKVSLLTTLMASLPGTMVSNLGDLAATFALSGALIPAGLIAGFTIPWLVALATFKSIPTQIKEAIGDLAPIGVAAAQSLVRGFRSVHIPSPKFSVSTMFANAAGVGFQLPNVNVSWLAQGGYVEKNTPRLAMIGDNRHYGEIVAPEDKMEAMVLKAAKLAAGSGDSTELLLIMKEILAYLRSSRLVELDPEAMRKYFIEKTNRNTIASGVSELIN